MTQSTKHVIRTVLQVLLGLLALAPVLVREAGLDPAQLPWLATALVVAAVVTRVMQTPQVQQLLALVGLDTTDGRHEVGRDEDRPDGGSARLGLVVLAGALAVSLVLLTASTASAHRRVRPLPVITGASVCAGTVTVDFVVVRLVAGELTETLDPGGVRAQVHFVGATEGDGWGDVERLAAGDGQARASVAGQPEWDLVRVVMPWHGHLVKSGGRSPEGRCAA